VAEQRPSFEDVDWRLRALNTSGWRGLVASHRQQKTRSVLEVCKKSYMSATERLLH
jgi:hypothetical protein